MSRLPRAKSVRIILWLLTPLVAWAAAFLGGWIGAASAGDGASVVSMLVGGVIGGTIAVAVWIVLVVRLGRRGADGAP